MALRIFNEDQLPEYEDGGPSVTHYNRLHQRYGFECCCVAFAQCLDRGLALRYTDAALKELSQLLTEDADPGNHQAWLLSRVRQLAQQSQHADGDVGEQDQAGVVRFPDPDLDRFMKIFKECGLQIREVVALHHHVGHPLETISQILNMSVDSVRRLLDYFEESVLAEEELDENAAHQQEPPHGVLLMSEDER